jgi:hypothetical protein
VERPVSARPLSILLLADAPRRTANTIRDHVGAFRRYSRHRVAVLNPRGLGNVPAGDLDAFDVVVIHYTIHPNVRPHVSPRLREQLRSFRGLKVQFLQDEYRQVDRMTAEMRELGVDILFSAVPEDQVPKVYGGRLEKTRVLPTLTGYVPAALAKTKPRPLVERPIEIGYRGRVVPWWLGQLGQEKVDIARGVLDRAAAHGLVCDVAWNEHDRMYGGRWNRFLATCRSTLLTESGASIVDFDGSVERRTQEYLDEHPSATYAEVHAAVLAPYEGNATINTVSPRAFEAAALRSALVAFPGEYSGVIQPGDHYVPLEKDFSNFGDVVERIRDLPTLEAIVDRTYDDLIRSGRYSFETFVHRFDAVVAEHASPRRSSSHLGPRLRTRRLAWEAARGVRLRSRLGETRESVRRALATARLLAADRDLRRLVAAYATDGAVRSSVRPGRLATDLLWLGIVRRAHRGAPATRSFAVDAMLDATSQRLVLRSRRRITPAAPVRPEAIRQALREGRVREVIWNHRAFGARCMYVPAFGGRPFALAVGYYGLNGLHEFGALMAIAERNPALACRALHPLTEPPTRSTRPALQSATLRLLPKPLLRGFLRRMRRRRLGRREQVVLLRRLRRFVRKVARPAVRKAARRARTRLGRATKVLRRYVRRASWKLSHVWHQVRW